MTSEFQSIDPTLNTGTRVGEYQVERLLGEGGFGTVYKVTHPLIGKHAAVKVLSRQFSVNPEMVQRFIDEARAVNQIQHKNIIDIFSFGQLDDGRQYYLMEYLDGCTLEALLEERGRLQVDEALPILKGIARALDAAHAKGIAHRDLKPENVYLIRDEGNYFPKLLDFGIAKLLGDPQDKHYKTRTGAPIGTPHYMSPEQCRGKDVDHRTDIYAFGVMCYRMFTGRLPFDGEEYMDVLFKQISDTAAPPSRLEPSLPFEFDDAVALMIRKDPKDRPRTLTDAVALVEKSFSTTAGSSPPSVTRTDARAASLGTSSSRSGSPTSMAQTQAGTLPTAMSLEPGVRKPRSIVFGVAATVVALVIAGSVVALTNFSSKESAPKPAPEPAPDKASAGPPLKLQEPTPQPPSTADNESQPVASPPVPKTVAIDLKGLPSGTVVSDESGTQLGVTPFELMLPRSDNPFGLNFARSGYRDGSERIIPNRDQVLAVELRTAPKRKPKKKSTQDRDALENPWE